MPTEITNWTELDAVRGDLTGEYVLMNDLDENSDGYAALAGPSANDGAGWLPIGSGGDPFTGVFDGGGFTIRDHVIRAVGESEDGYGIFGGNQGAISDLHVTADMQPLQVTVPLGIYFKPISFYYQTPVGNMSQYDLADITIDNVSVKPANTATELVTNGGFTGNADGWTLGNGWSYDSNHLHFDEASALGSEIVTNGSFTGSATGWTLGAGWAYGTNNAVHSGGSHGEVDDTISQQLVGVEIGHIYILQLTLANHGAGFGPAIRIGESYAMQTGTIDGDGTFTYIFNSDEDDPIIYIYSEADVDLDNVSVKELTAGDAFQSLDIDIQSFYDVAFDVGGTAGSLLYGLPGVGESEFSFDGGNIAAQDVQSFYDRFNYLNYAGAIVGYNYDGGTIDNCSADGNILGDGNIGGIVGMNYAETAEVTNCVSYVNLQSPDGDLGGSETFGGLAGQNIGHIANCHSHGLISVGLYGEVAGGFVGHNAGLIEDCWTDARIYQGNSIGGFVGYTDMDGFTYIIRRCHAHGDVIGRGNGFEEDITAFGGFAGQNGNGHTIQECYATGRVTAENVGDTPFDTVEEIGGFVGSNSGYIHDCYATGYVGNGDLAIGGFAGLNETEGSEEATDGDIDNCYSIGLVAAVQPSQATDYITNGGFTGNANDWTLGSTWTYGSNKVSYAEDLGSNLVSNGTFTGNASGWSFGSDWTYSSNHMVCDGTGDSINLIQTIGGGLDEGAFYRVQFDIDGTGVIGVIMGSGQSNAFTGDGTSRTVVFYLQAGDGENLHFFSNDYAGNFDNVILQKVNARNGEITQDVGSSIYGDKYELTMTVGGTIGGVFASLGASSQNFFFPAGATTSVNITNYETAGGDGLLHIQASTGFNGDLDNVIMTAPSIHAGGLIGKNGTELFFDDSSGQTYGPYAGDITNSFWDEDTSNWATSAGGTGKSTAEMKDIDTFTDDTTPSPGLDVAWDMVADVDDTHIWGILAGMNDGYPFLQTGMNIPMGAQAEAAVATTKHHERDLFAETEGQTSVVKQVQKTLAMAIEGLVDLTSIAAFAAAAVIEGLATLAISVNKNVRSAIYGVATLTKHHEREFDTQVEGAVAFTATKVVLRTIAAVIDGVADLVAEAGVYARTLAAEIEGSATAEFKQTAKSMYAQAEAPATIKKDVSKNLTAGVEAEASVTKSFTELIEVSAEALAEVSRTLVVIFEAAIDGVADISTQLGKGFRANIAGAVGITKHVTKSVVASVAGEATIQKRVGKAMIAVLEASVSLLKGTQKTLAAVVDGAASEEHARVVVLQAAIAGAATIARAINKNILAPVTAFAEAQLKFYVTKYVHQDDDYTIKY